MSTTPTSPATYSFLVPGWTTVHVKAESEDVARDRLAEEVGTTIEWDTPITSGPLRFVALDLTAPAARIDRIGETLCDGALPDVDFHVSDIAWATARILKDGWRYRPCTWGGAGYLEWDGDDSLTYQIRVDYDAQELYLGLGSELGRITSFGKLSPRDGLTTIAHSVAAAVRKHLADVEDRQSAMSLRHHRENGRYLRHGEVALRSALRDKAKDLLDRWEHAIDEDGSNDEEHDVGSDMADLLRNFCKNFAPSE